MGGFRKGIKKNIKDEYRQLSDAQIEQIIEESERKVDEDENNN